MLERSVNRITTTPPLGPGFAGERHQATLVVAPGDFSATDPFFLMADDHVTAEGQFGEAHPHAGLETVTFMLHGTMEDAGGRLVEGDVEWMTAGSGIVHSEDARVSTGMRLFQLWLVLPERDRNIAPRVQILRRDEMPVHRGDGFEATVYSGRSAGIIAPAKNAVPVTLADIHLETEAEFEQVLPSSYNGFVVVIAGEIEAGTGRTLLTENKVGWTSPVAVHGDSFMRLKAGKDGARVLLYAGQPQNIHVVAQGPFIAGSKEELAGYYATYRQGKFPNAGEMRPV
ncbi:redox-sensitive bicupin YhaK (pirin superfamily) [Agrobacterium pusense]|uniref:pirin family protein n=1 Tax=Agrobacterium pusense TaxID=648995 RepID=UPI00285947EA|nr:pirin family protein [Agrobacterium pusense]MDR6192584.1 redox-sensitive bicupin YhaK (pirin superfamily) [Agrobacterium pusense]